MGKEIEQWVPAFGYEGLYSVSSLGRVRSEDRVVRHFSGGPKRLRGSLRAFSLNCNGYLDLVLSKDGANVRHRVHRLVLSSFTREAGAGMDVRHIDGDRTNNRIANLCWGTRKDNMADAIVHGTTNRGMRCPTRKLDESAVLAILADTRSQVEIAKHFGVDQSTISLIRRGKRWGHLSAA